MTMHLPTRRFLSVNFWRSKRRLSCPSPPYSPDFAPGDFFLFPKSKSTLKGRRFQKVEEITAFAPSSKTRSRTRSRTGKKAGSGVSTVEGSTLKETSLSCKYSNKFKKKKFGIFLDCPRTYVRTYIHTHTHTHIHTYIHTYIRM